MTTAELIKELKRVDPEGTTHVCVNNHPVDFVYPQEAYYDGLLEVIDKVRRVGKRVHSGRKISLETSSIKDALEDPTFTVEYELERDKDCYGPRDKFWHDWWLEA